MIKMKRERREYDKDEILKLHALAVDFLVLPAPPARRPTDFGKSSSVVL
jgi:hypothetical protein